MKEVELQAEKMINQMFEMEYVKTNGTIEINLHDSHEINFPKMINLIPHPDEVEKYQQILDMHYAECSHLSKSQFQKILNTFITVESLFFQLVSHYYSEEEAQSVRDDAAQATVFYMRIVSQMLDDEDNLRMFYKEIQEIAGSKKIINQIIKERQFTVTVPELSLAYASQDLIQRYRHCINEKELKTDFHSYTKFLTHVKLLLDQVTEVLCKLHTLYDKSD